VNRVIDYVAPFTRSNREQDYQTVWATLDAAQAHFFDKSTGASLGIRLE